jgi:hypothetical protein
MSSQIDDEFIYNDNKYYLSAVEFPEKFIDIYSLGIKPTEFHTACYRGFVATFAINNEKLVLNKLYTNNGNKIENEVPMINNKLPKISVPNGLLDEYKNSWREFTYEDIDFVIDYTGSIIIVKDYINKYISGPYAFLSISPFCYKEIIKLTFVEGNLTNIKDLSKYCDKIRTERNNISNDKERNDAYFGWPNIDDLFKENFADQT